MILRGTNQRITARRSISRRSPAALLLEAECEMVLVTSSATAIGAAKSVRRNQ